MNRFFAELYKKPDHHKKLFALLASGTITLFIFGAWSLTFFGTSSNNIAKVDNTRGSIKANQEISPIESIGINLANSLEAIKNSWGLLKSSFENKDFDTEYTNMKDNVFDIYGQ